jgi:hypothetical protein
LHHGEEKRRWDKRKLPRTAPWSEAVSPSYAGDGSSEADRPRGPSDLRRQTTWPQNTGTRLKEAAPAVRDGAAEVDALRLVGGGTNSRMVAVRA